ncbi:MAG: hypothetical protein L0H73_15235 [Nitrococcus sp.]|nr:hypothetical protein [Nitrococcus sp.]
MNLATYCRQAEFKAQVFKAVGNGLQNHLRDTFSEPNSKYRMLEPFAEKYLQLMINPELSPSNRVILRVLFWFNRVLTAFTSYLRTVFSQEKLLPDAEDRTGQGKSLETRWQEFCDAMHALSTKNKDIPPRKFDAPPLSGTGASSLDMSKDILNHAEMVVDELHAMYEQFVGHLKPYEIKGPVRSEIVILYDLANSSGYRVTDRMKLLQDIQDNLAARTGADSNVQFERTDNDGTWLRVKSIANAIHLAYGLRNIALLFGVALAIEMCSTKETAPFVDSHVTELGWSTAIPVCARIESEVKATVRKDNRETTCVVTEYIVNLATDVGDLADTTQFEKLGRIDPRGETLPPLNLFKFLFNDEQDHGSYPY